MCDEVSAYFGRSTRNRREGEIYQEEIKMIWKGYKYLFFRIYSWNLKKWGEKDLPQYNAMLGVSFLTMMNFFTICIIIDNLFGTKLFLFLINPESKAIIISLLWLILNYRLLLYKKIYKKIKQEFECVKDKSRGAFLIWIYILFSFAFAIFVAVISKIG